MPQPLPLVKYRHRSVSLDSIDSLIILRTRWKNKFRKRNPTEPDDVDVGLTRETGKVVKPLKASILDSFFSLLSIVTYTADIVTDGLVSTQYFINGDLWWFGFTTAFIILPSIVMQILSCKWYKDDNIHQRWYSYILHIFQLGPIERNPEVVMTSLTIVIAFLCSFAIGAYSSPTFADAENKDSFQMAADVNSMTSVEDDKNDVPLTSVKEDKNDVSLTSVKKDKNDVSLTDEMKYDPKGARRRRGGGGYYGGRRRRYSTRRRYSIRRRYDLRRRSVPTGRRRAPVRRRRRAPPVRRRVPFKRRRYTARRRRWVWR